MRLNFEPVGVQVATFCCTVTNLISDPATLKQRIAELEKIVATQRKELFELRKFKIDTLAKRLKKK